MSDLTGDTQQPTETPNDGSPKRAKAGFFSRVLWVGPRVAEARANGFGPGHPAYAWFETSRQICDDVVKIGETGATSWSVLLLDCSAIQLLVRAHLVRAQLIGANARLGEEEWGLAHTMPAVELAWGKLSSEHASILESMLGPDRDAIMTSLSGKERETFADAIHDLVKRLAEPLEMDANRLGRALFARWSRVAVVLLVVAVAGILGGKWLDKKFGKPNLALHMPVTTSSQFPGQGADHTLLVDGDPDTMGFHTMDGGQQWVVIDLGRPRKFDKIVVYNRPDGFEERAIPIKIEISNDNVNYTQIAERKENFDKWTAKKLHAEARYIRLKNTPPNYFHLGEVEVY